jgi:hypothetical protein
MIYKLRNEIHVEDLHLIWLIDNPHPGTAKIIEENLESFSMEDLHYMLQYPHLMDIITKRLYILNSQYLSKNSDAIHILIQNPDLIDWYMLSTNSSYKALEIIEQNIINDINKKKGIETKKLPIHCDKIYSDCPAFWRLLATNTNPKAVELIEKYYKLNEEYFNLDSVTIDLWRYLSKNENKNAIDLLEKYPQYINWETILENQNPKAIEIIEKNLDKIYVDDWPILSGNPAAIHIFKDPEYLKKVYEWSYISKNKKAMPILQDNLDKVEWIAFSSNPSAINIIIQIIKEQKDYNKKIKNHEEINTKDYKYFNYFNKIDYGGLSRNPAIFELDKQGLKERCDIYREELIEKAMHPSRIQKLLDMGIDVDDLDLYF